MTDSNGSQGTADFSWTITNTVTVTNPGSQSSLSGSPITTLAISASVSGVLFTINSALPFTLIAIVSAVLAVSTLWWWRNVTGNITHSATA